MKSILPNSTEHPLRQLREQEACSTQTGSHSLFMGLLGNAATLLVQAVSACFVHAMSVLPLGLQKEQALHMMRKAALHTSACCGASVPGAASSDESWAAGALPPATDCSEAPAW